MIDTFRTLLVDPLMEMLRTITGFIPTLVSVLVLLVIGIVAARLIHDLVQRLLRELKIDVIADKFGVTDALHKGGVKHKLSDLISSLVYLIVIVSFFFMTVKVIGLTMMLSVIDRIVRYIPQVVSAVLVLVLGIIVAKFVGRIISVTARATGMPDAKFMERLSRWAIIFYAATIALEELGYGALLVGTTFNILFGGAVFAYALAFGLGGKDMAAKYLDSRKRK